MLLQRLIVITLTLVCQDFCFAQYRGDSCRIARTGGAGICTPIQNCPAVIADLKKGIRPSICSFEGFTQIICCPLTPESNRISSQKCKEYEKYVQETTLVPSRYPDEPPVNETQTKCGQTGVALIVGGTEAGPLEFPHMALIGFGDSLADVDWKCGGSLISERFVLTAAHCQYQSGSGNARFVRLGELSLESVADDARPANYEITQIIPHPSYVSNSNYHDIALMRLNRAVVLSPYVKPACMPKARTSGTARAIATGWGTIDFGGPTSAKLLKVVLDLWNHTECLPSFPNERRLPNGLQEDSQMCAGSRTEEKDTCQGDSGGPLQVYHPNNFCQYTIIGITSFGKGCGLAGVPAVYTRVFNYLDWIEKNVWPN